MRLRELCSRLPRLQGGVSQRGRYTQSSRDATRTDAADDEGSTEPQPCLSHLPAMRNSDDGEEDGKQDGGRETGDVMPEVNSAILLEGRHDDCLST